MTAKGWNITTLKPGIEVTVTGSVIKDDDNAIGVTRLVLSSGQELYKVDYIAAPIHGSAGWAKEITLPTGQILPFSVPF